MAKADHHPDNGLLRAARARFSAAVEAAPRGDQQALRAAGLVLADLAAQGWRLRIASGHVTVASPDEIIGDRSAEKQRVRRQELLKRDAQLRSRSVRDFILRMERPRVVDGQPRSIFSLMRDGRALADAFEETKGMDKDAPLDSLKVLVDPYLQIVENDESSCPFTKLRLMDIWRYFRHTWSNQYTSVPGRSMAFLVRDRAAAFHPVMGIGAIGSPVVQIRERDIWVGWHPDVFMESVRARPTAAIARWLQRIVDAAIGEIYVDDLIDEEILTPRALVKPDAKAVARLQRYGAVQRRRHHRFVRARDHKTTQGSDSDDFWIERARTHLFRSKRALTLADLLEARRVMQAYFQSGPSARKLKALVESRDGSDVVRKVLRKAKADRVGIAVADITVCGAVQPYNAILGGKLVAMLSASPEIVTAYRRRYARARSEIASAVAGRPIVRKPSLVLLGTTSLYGASSMYNRIKLPSELLGGNAGWIKYEELGRSEAFGTSQYSDETVDALVGLVHHETGGRRVNSIFGEGVSPKMRKVREGLDLLDFPSADLLRHHRRRVVYAVSLISNLRDFLLGIDARPKFVVPIDDGMVSSAAIAGWWRERWLRNRVQSRDVLDELRRHTLVRPVRHGARVVVPRDDDGQMMLPDVE